MFHWEFNSFDIAVRILSASRIEPRTPGVSGSQMAVVVVGSVREIGKKYIHSPRSRSPLSLVLTMNNRETETSPAARPRSAELSEH